jgi:hypothetical protein
MWRTRTKRDRRRWIRKQSEQDWVLGEGGRGYEAEAGEVA